MINVGEVEVEGQGKLRAKGRLKEPALESRVEWCRVVWNNMLM